MSDCSRQTDCRVMSRVGADAAFPPHTAQPGPWSRGKTLGRGPGACPLLSDVPPLALCPWVSRLTSLGEWRCAPSSYANTALLWTGAPTPSPVLHIPGLISSSQQPWVAGIPTRVVWVQMPGFSALSVFSKASPLVYQLCVVLSLLCPICRLKYTHLKGKIYFTAKKGIPISLAAKRR